MKTIAGALLFFIAMTTQAKPGAIVIHAGAEPQPRRIYLRARTAVPCNTRAIAPRRNAIINIVGSAIDAIETAIVITEDATVFNAGKGVVFTADGKTNSTPRSCTETRCRPARSEA